ncbi:unnamed protein product [Vicia faba]|uniref:Uncharacterized protein n=1 Tax=Vicia faba TaxID=3906 RepID=A0AAV0Z440_VICFA|nr:unnamed protein product [Vicia faba]
MIGLLIQAHTTIDQTPAFMEAMVIPQMFSHTLTAFMEPSPPITTTTHRYNHSHRRVVDVVHTNGHLSSVSHPIQLHLLTRTPYVTGSSVIAIKYKDGILMAAGMGGSYGSTRRYKSVERLKPVGKHSIIGASGEISDFQEIQHYLNELIWLRVLLQVVPLKQR